MAISNLLEIGKRSLLANQSAMNTTAGNITNANTPGYSRRRVDISNISVQLSSLQSIGIGVEADTFYRIRMQTIDARIWQETPRLGQFETDERVLNQVEGVLGVNTDGSLSSVLSDFWDSWNELANDPESQTARRIVADKGALVGSTLNNLHRNFSDMRNQVSSEIDATVDSLNRMVSQLESINREMINGANPDLEDQRDLLIGSISKLIEVDVDIEDSGVVNLRTDGLTLVSGTESTELETTVVTDGDKQRMTIGFEGHEFTPRIASGELGSLLNAYNRRMPDYIKSLDTIAGKLVSAVNDQHESGYNLDGISGISFFDPENVSAGNISISSEVNNDPSLIATRSSATGVGNNDIAMNILALEQRQLANDKTIGDYFGNLLTEIGSRLDESRLNLNSQTLVTGQLENQRDSVSGVSLDEELTKMVQYEQAYQASTRVIRTVEEMMDTLMSIV